LAALTATLCKAAGPAAQPRRDSMENVTHTSIVGSTSVHGWQVQFKMQDGKLTRQMNGKIRKITILFEKVTFLNEMRLSKTRARELDMPHLALIHELK